MTPSAPAGAGSASAAGLFFFFDFAPFASNRKSEYASASSPSAMAIHRSRF
jgi:hypothetical protein